VSIKAISVLFKEAFYGWFEINAPRLGAALAYYTVFSLAPLLIIVIAIAGFFFGQEAAQGQLVHQLADLVGPESAKAIEAMIQNARNPATGSMSAALGLVTLILGATGVFGELQADLNEVWNVPPKATGGIMGFIKARFVSFTMVLGIGFLLLVSLILSTVLAALGTFIGSLFPGFMVLLHFLNFVISFGGITLLFAMMYKILPDVNIEWRDVWIGAAVTSLLFSLGKLAIGFYLGKSSISSPFGAAGSLIVILVWVYYSAQIFLYGAEFAKVYSEKYGSGKHAEQQSRKQTELSQLRASSSRSRA
jgi:membrane protein